MSVSEAKTAILFPGQGLPLDPESFRSFYDNDTAVRELVDAVDFCFDDGTKLRSLCLEGGEQLADTRYAQASLFLASMAMSLALDNVGIQVDAVAGLSLGEYAALCYAGSFDVQPGIALMAERGKIMADAIPSDSGMASIYGLSSEEVDDMCKQARQYGSCGVATYSTDNRLVVTGNNSAIDCVLQQCFQLSTQKERVQAVRLGTSRAFHSDLAKPAAEQFESVIQDQEFVFEPPKLPVYFNVDGRPDHTDIATVEVEQFYRSVQLQKTIEHMCKDGIQRFIAIGPGVSLAAYARENAKAIGLRVETLVLEKYDDLATIMQKVSSGRA